MEVEPLRRVPVPPQVYGEFKALLRRHREPSELERALKKFGEKHPKWMDEVRRYMEELEEVREQNLKRVPGALLAGRVACEGEGLDPLEVLRDGEEERLGLLWDFDFVKGEGLRRLYVILEPELLLQSLEEEVGR